MLLSQEFSILFLALPLSKSLTLPKPWFLLLCSGGIRTLDLVFPTENEKASLELEEQ